MAKSAPKPDEPSTNDFVASLFEQHAEDLFNHITPLNRRVSSGSMTLDQHIHARSGGVIRITAKQAEAGKTSQSFVFAGEFMSVMPKSKTLYIMAEGRLSLEMKARSGFTFVYHPKDWVYGTVLVLATNTFEVAADFIVKVSKEIFDKDEKLCIILDSLDGLILKADKDTKGVVDGKVAGVAKLTKLLFRHVALPIAFYDILLIITSQYSVEITLDQYAPKIPRLGEASGGSSVPHQCDYILQALPRWNGDFILEDPDEKPDAKTNKIIGVWVTWEVKKSATDVSGIKLRVPIKKGRVGSAIWVEKEVVDLALSYDLLKREGPKSPMYAFDPALIKEAKEAGVELKEKIKGFANIYDYVEGDSKVFQWLLARFKKLLGTQEAA